MNSQHSNGQQLHSNNMMMSSPPSSHGGEIQISPHIQPNSPVYENSSYVNHQQVNLYGFIEYRILVEIIIDILSNI